MITSPVAGHVEDTCQFSPVLFRTSSVKIFTADFSPFVNAVLPVTMVTPEKNVCRPSDEPPTGAPMVVWCLGDKGCDIAVVWNSIPAKQEIIQDPGNRKFII